MAKQPPTCSSTASITSLSDMSLSAARWTTSREGWGAHAVQFCVRQSSTKMSLWRNNPACGHTSMICAKLHNCRVHAEYLVSDCLADDRHQKGTCNRSIEWTCVGNRPARCTRFRPRFSTARHQQLTLVAARYFTRQGWRPRGLAENIFSNFVVVLTLNCRSDPMEAQKRERVNPDWTQSLLYLEQFHA